MMEVDLKWIIDEEERTRHDALFYSQKPKDGVLSGEQARSLFIRSRLPLSELSKIWKLADISRDNLLDVSEFATAMHLIQLRIKGFEIPEKLPTSLMPIRVPVIDLPVMTLEERQVYQRLFCLKKNSNSGFVETVTACEIMMMSKLDYKVLAKIWNLSDTDRDTKLSPDEFAIALHLLRICKNGYNLEGSIDVVAMLPAEEARETEETKRQRLTELQTEKRNLFTVKEKLCLKISLGENEKEIQESYRPELSKVEQRLYSIEKEETELRKVLQNLREKSKKEGFKPFDRNYIVKKRVSGEELFKGLQRNPYVSQSDDALLFERLLTESEQLNDIKVPGGEIKVNLTSNDNTQWKQESPTQSELQTTASIHANKSACPALVNGLDETNHESEKQIISIETSFTEAERDSSPLRQSSQQLTPHGDRETSSGNISKEVEEDTLSWVPTSTRQTIVKTVEENLIYPEPPGIASKEDEEADAEDSFSWVPSGKREVIIATVDEELLVPAKTGATFENRVSVSPIDAQFEKLERETLDIDKPNSNCKYTGNNIPHAPVEEEVVAGVSKTSESAADANIDTLLRQMSQDVDSSHMNGTSNTVNPASERGPIPSSGQGSHKLPVGRVLSDDEESALIEAGVLSKEKPAHYYKQISKEDTLYIEEIREKEEERKRIREIDDIKRRQAREELQTKEEEMQRQLDERKYALREVKGKLEMQMSMAEQDEIPVGTSRLEADQLIEIELEDQKRKEAETRRIAQEMKAIEAQEQEKDKMRARKTTAAKQVFVDEGANVEQQAITAVPRRPKKAVPPSHDNRKSWVELEVERQKQKEEALKQELAQRKQDMQRRDSESKQRDQVIKRQIEISKDPRVDVVSSNSVESRPRISVKQTTNVHSVPGVSRNAASTQPKYESQREVHTTSQVHTSGNVNSLSISHRNVADSGGRKTQDGVDAKERSQSNVSDEGERRRRVEDETFRQESLKREAEELLRQKRIREEELQRRRDAALKEATKRKKEEEERNALHREASESRRFAFHANKVQLEERVLKAMEEKHCQETLRSRSSSSSSEEPVALFGNTPAANSEVAGNTDGVVMRERRTSVRESLSRFEQPANKKQTKEVVRRNRFSLNLEEAAKPDPEVRKLGKSNRSSYYGDGFMAREVQKQLEREEELLRKTGNAPQKPNQTESSKAPNVIVIPKGNPPPKDMAQRREHRAAPPPPFDHVDGPNAKLAAMSEDSILREIEELKLKEQELQTRRNMLEKIAAPSGSRKELDDIKRNPLPSKVQMRNVPHFNAPSSKPVMAAASKPVPPTVTSSNPPQLASEEPPKKQSAVRKSFIELEKEKELQREEELKKEREAVRQELQSREEQRKKSEEEAAEQKRTAQEEKKISTQRKISGLAFMFEKNSHP